MKLQDIHPNPKNPRFLRKEKSEWLEDSLNEFGDLSGYVFNKGGMIISAHQRWEKIKPKVKEVVIRETFKKPLPDGTIERGHFELNDGTKHDYSVRDWTPEKADRATIRANAQNAGEWDADVLANQWEYEPEALQDMGVPEWVFGGDGDENGQDVDYSEKNKEIDVNEFSDLMELKFKYEKDAFLDVQERLNVVCAKQNVDTKEAALTELLMFYERHG